MKLKNQKPKSFLKKVISLLCYFLIVSPVYSGTNCGSDTPTSKLYKQTSSDWWPDTLSSLIITVAVPVGGLSSAFCAASQGQAFFGAACYSHDACYDGKEGLGMTREECDSRLRNGWKQSCEDKYNPGWWGDYGQQFCRDYCKNTADAMYDVLSATSKEAWDASSAERDKNISAAINGVYTDVFHRVATTQELLTSKNYLASTKSLDALRIKVKQDYDRMSATLPPIMQFLLE